MRNTPIERKLIDETIADFHITDFAKATIREVKAIAANAEAASGVEFIKMEMGVPGLPPSAVGVKAEVEALQNGIASLYPDINGLPALKEEASRFIKAFINVDVAPEGCVPVTGSMQGTFASFLTCSQCDEKKDTILFIDPGFPVQKQQLVVMGQKYETFDVYDYRGDKLKAKLESYLSKGNISAIVYSNPNNPSWICLKEEELRIIGELATQYDVIVLEDLAYFAMDFRQDLSKPFQAPYQPSVAHYTDYAAHFRFQSFQLCRSTYRCQLHFGQTVSPGLSRVDTTLRRRHLRHSIHPPRTLCALLRHQPLCAVCSCRHA